MHLTLQLLRSFRPGRRAQGNRLIGKHRIAHRIYPDNIVSFVKTLKIEENNLFLLRHPYLTVEQERGHANALGKPFAWTNENRVYVYARRMKLSTRMEDVLGGLNVASKWELT